MFYNIDIFVKEIEKLKLAYELLEQVYVKIGAYNEGKINDDLCYKIREYFNFDDSY